MRRQVAFLTAGFAMLASCTPQRTEPARDAHASRVAGTAVAVVDTTIDAVFDAAGVAEPFQRSTLSTKLMGTVVAVLVHEGESVREGQPLVRIDARDLTAKEAQVAASITDAEANHGEATSQAMRIRGLYMDSAATKAQLDAAETGLARAEAAVRMARAAAAELGAVREYAVVRAPFAGTVTQRLVDAGAFAAPGTPLVTVEDIARLRIVANAAPDVVRSLRRGTTLRATIEGRGVNAIVEGVVPATAGNLYTVNALVPNAGRTLLAGSTASLALPLGKRQVLCVPLAALHREGDLTGVLVRGEDGDALRWVRIGESVGGGVEVTAGLQRGDRVVIPLAKSTAVTTSERRK